MPCEPAISLLGIYLDKTLIQKDTCTPIFIAALLTIAKTQKQPKCPPTDEWMKMMWYIYTMQYYSVIKKNELCHRSNMDGPRGYHTRRSKPDKDRYHVTRYVWEVKKKGCKWTHLQKRNRFTDTENRWWLPSSNGLGERQSEVWDSVQFSCSVVSNSLWPHGLQHARPPCPSPTPGTCSNSRPSSWWCHATISSSVIPFYSHLQSFPASGSFPMSQFFKSGGQSTGASASVLPMNIQDWFPLGWTGWISLQSKGLSRVFCNTTVQKHQFFSTQLSLWSNSHIHTWPLEKP